MRAKQTIIAFATFGFLTLSMSQQGYATMDPFTDVSQGAAVEKITSLQERGYLHGVNKTQFLPDSAITAAQGIHLIVNAVDLNLDGVRFLLAPKASDYFPNADNNAWYADVFIIAANNGLDLPGDLDPNMNWSREEFLHHLIRAMELHGNLPMINIVPVEMNDQDELNPNYQGSIQRSIAYGITKLDIAGNMHPKDDITRREAAELIYNALEYLKTHSSQPQNFINQ